jgi:hypothetical protein
MQRYVNETMERMEDRFRIKIDKIIDDKMANLECFVVILNFVMVVRFPFSPLPRLPIMQEGPLAGKSITREVEAIIRHLL